jgi:hypothetical protein
MNIGIRTIILIILGVIGTIALTYGNVYSIPDAVEVRYGLPLTWGARAMRTTGQSRLHQPPVDPH